MDSRECTTEGKGIIREKNTKECVDQREGKTNHHDLKKENATNAEDTRLWRRRKDIEKTCKDDECMQSISESSDDTFIDDLHDEHPFSSESDDDKHSVASLSDTEIEELVFELFEIESKAADAQEALETESLKQVEKEVRTELAHDLQGDELEIAVSTEMRTFTEQWEVTLDELETECTSLLEQLDGSGIELSAIYKWIESQASNECFTEAWKKRIQWIGSQATPEMTDAVSKADKYLQSCYPVRRKHGKLLEEGASGFLSKKLSVVENQNFEENSEKNWKSFNAYIQTSKDDDTKTSFGSTKWASVYLASTPQQAAEMGLTFPGVDEVEEIDEISIDYFDPFYADAVANENCNDLSEKQRQNYRKIREEDDAIITKKLQNNLIRHRHKRQRQKHQGFSKNNSSPVDQDPRVTFNNDPPLLFSGNVHISDEVLNNDIGSSHKLEADVFLSSGCRNENIPCLSENIDVTKKTSFDIVIIDSDDEGKAVDQSDSIISRQHQVNCQSSFQVKETMNLNDVDAYVATECLKNFHCTICFEVLGICKFHKHPLLNVIVCERCKLMMEGKMQNKDDEAHRYCGFCGRSNDLQNCDFCNMLFCITCIKRNLREDQFLFLKATNRKCFGCSPILLENLTLDYEKACNSVLLSSSSSDSQQSVSTIHVVTRKNKKRKRKLRRILDDAELGEETKQKIEVERARQEHLKSLQFSYNRCRNDETSTKIMEEGNTQSGYIVNIAREENEELVRIPPSISSKLKFHQIEGIRFMWENIIQSVKKARSGDKGLGCILAHTMGLGKTFQVISFLYCAFRSIDLGLKTAIIVAPVNVLHNWKHEFLKWKPLDVKALRVYMLEDVLRDRRLHLLCKWKKKGGVLLIGYSSFRNIAFGKHVKDKITVRDMSCALQEPDILICDEAHMIKNTKADITQALKQVKSQRRIALTGSPLQNNLMEYYCMVDFVREGFLGSSLEFRNRFQNPIENGQHTNSSSVDVKIMNQRSHILYEQLKGFVQRRDMNVVKNDLPPKTVYVISVKLSPLQRKLYKKFLDVHATRRGSFFAGYQALAQIWNHPGLLQMAQEHRDSLLREDIVENFLDDDTSSDDNIEDGHIFDDDGQRSKNDSLHKRSDGISFHEDIDWWKDIICEKIYKEVDHSGKMVLLLDILSMSSEIGDKALIFSQSIATLDLIERFLSKLPRIGTQGKYWKHGKDWYRIDGRTKGSERQKIIDSFNDFSNTKVKCTLISTRAGSLGINLHSANRVIIFDGSWNPTNDLQAIYRAWRYGQQKPVFAYRLMAHGTMEEKIYKRQVKKEGLAARVMDRQQIHRTMSKEEMLHLFDFGDDESIDSVLGHNQQDPLPSNQDRTSNLSDFLNPKGISLSDKLMESLLNKHHPRWIQDYHEHETLFQENEDERLSKEEQDSAMETFLKTIEWEEVQRVSDVSTSYDKRAPRNPAPLTEERSLKVNTITSGLSNRQSSARKCTNLSHMLSLRSQGTKTGSKTICGDCSQEISWENLRIGKPK